MTLLLLTLSLHAAEVPETLFLSWEGNPCRTMTAQWLRGPGFGDRPDAKKPEEVRWRKAGGGEWQVLTTKTQPFPDPGKKGLPRWMVIKANWEDLEPGAEYVFRFGDSAEMKFRTAPEKLVEGVTFVEAGDCDVTKRAEEMISLGCRQDPLFFSVGGDLAYGDWMSVAKEIAFLQQWSRSARTSAGRLVPLVAGIGNHEVMVGYVQDGATFEQMKAQAPFFYTLFGGLYRTAEPVALDFGDYLSMLLLDSGHLIPIKEQTGWLEKNLNLRKVVPWVFVSWHVMAFPSARSWNSQKEIVDVRREWVPVLERSQVAAVFNHHDHNLQRVETEGKFGRKIQFLGNGAIGVEARPVQCQESKRLAKAWAEENYVNVISIRRDGTTVRSLAPDGRELDRVDLEASRAR
ncbi:MAG: metallophosphoesterase [Verrucomicrobia bacterium]|nr:metallophosphoesterase [Verrucomicrobiota bacterium]